MTAGAPDAAVRQEAAVPAQGLPAEQGLQAAGWWFLGCEWSRTRC